MQTADFRFDLPERLIAQQPASARELSRLLVLERSTGRCTHWPKFLDFPRLLRPGDVLVLNNSRVIPARLRGRKTVGGGEVELLLVERVSEDEWWTLLKPGRRVRPGTEITLQSSPSGQAATAVVQEKNSEGHCRLKFSLTGAMEQFLEETGETPLPPYIGRRAGNSDRERYQTVYAKFAGSVAAPTAGLHFSQELLSKVRHLGVEICELTLDVGLGTFAPVKAPDLQAHVMHEERFTLGRETAAQITAARDARRRVIAVGTTTVRVLESVALANSGRLVATEGRTRIFIYPPYRFQVVDALLTNFHLPESTLLMLVSAFAAPEETRGRELVLNAYAEAIRHDYRFFSYGDAMFIV